MVVFPIDTPSPPLLKKRNEKRNKMNDDEFDNLLDQYRTLNGGSGNRILRDLKIFCSATVIDRLDPNPNAAVYRMGQQSIIDRIEKMRTMRKADG